MREETVLIKMLESFIGSHKLMTDQLEIMLKWVKLDEKERARQRAELQSKR